MLQQTQVATVIDYFNRFMDRFPDVQSLADADLQDVLEIWAGLGYYSRARNLHRAAKQMVAEPRAEVRGQVPDSLDGLLALPGIGRYTAGAIRSIAFNKPAPILDGNVARVLCRVFAIGGDPKSPPVQRRMWELAERLVAPRRASEFNQGMMELGALVCTPAGPRCDACPLATVCRARALGRQADYPANSKKTRVLAEQWAVALVARGDAVLMARRADTGRWAGLWEFPGLVVDADADGSAELRRLLAESAGLKGLRFQPLGQVRHQLSHRAMTVDAYLAATRSRRNLDGFEWVPRGRIGDRPVSRLTRKIAALLGE